ncbi:helix-turn-helix domain-containing protein [Allomuricauda sp. CP2A]|jgi:AraC-like DNA-binding protein|uniref:helix-turn-helix domain-containing protein n=1 Tax=Allomuricauda sp. CP2A TaxID=1848189 RepID=UPI00082C3685|nr:AraC family transcriptional regulator [Muricauda sp. CP2A]
MEYVKKLKEIIEEKQRVRKLAHKKSVFLFLISNGKNQLESDANKDYQFLFQLEVLNANVVEGPLVIGMYNGVFGKMNLDMEYDSFQKQSLLDDALSNQLAIYLTQELLYRPSEDKWYLENMIVTMADYLVKQTSRNLTNIDGHKMGITPFQMQKLKNHIIENMDHQISTTDLASLVKLSVHHFIRMFKRTTGETPQQFAKRLKMQRAKELLLYSEDNIIQVGMGIGCDNASHFTQLFKSSYGITPLKFRKAHRQMTRAAS